MSPVAEPSLRVTPPDPMLQTDENFQLPSSWRRISFFEHISRVISLPQIEDLASVAASRHMRVTIGGWSSPCTVMVISHRPGLRRGRAAGPAGVAGEAAGGAAGLPAAGAPASSAFLSLLQAEAARATVQRARTVRAARMHKAPIYGLTLAAFRGVGKGPAGTRRRGDGLKTA